MQSLSAGTEEPIVMRPESGLSKPLISLQRVLFPEPSGPVIITQECGTMERMRLSKTLTLSRS